MSRDAASWSLRPTLGVAITMTAAIAGRGGTLANVPQAGGAGRISGFRGRRCALAEDLEVQELFLDTVGTTCVVA